MSYLMKLYCVDYLCLNLDNDRNNIILILPILSPSDLKAKSKFKYLTTNKYNAINYNTFEMSQR